MPAPRAAPRVTEEGSGGAEPRGGEGEGAGPAAALRPIAGDDSGRGGAAHGGGARGRSSPSRAGGGGVAGPVRDYRLPGPAGGHGVRSEKDGPRIYRVRSEESEKIRKAPGNPEQHRAAGRTPRVGPFGRRFHSSVRQTRGDSVKMSREKATYPCGKRPTGWRALVLRWSREEQFFHHNNRPIGEGRGRHDKCFDSTWKKRKFMWLEGSRGCM